MATALLDSLLQQTDAAAASEPDWLIAARDQARADLARDGVPAPRNEAWKYTSLRALGARTLAAHDENAANHALSDLDLHLPGVAVPRLVFVNGVYRADLSELVDIEGLRVQSLASVLISDAEVLRERLGRHFDQASQVFARLNTALVEDGLVVDVAAGAKITQPLHIVFAGAAAQTEMAWSARLLVELGEDSRLQLIEHYVAEAGTTHVGNVVGQHVLHARAELDLLQIQLCAESATLIRHSEMKLESDAQMRMHSIEAGAQLMRHDLQVALNGDRSRFESHGVFSLHGRQHSDTQLDVRHQARDTSCNVLWRGVADERSRGVFRGAITVAVGADGSDAQLSNKNLLLSAQAEIDTQPALEIYADEVKAAHGATVGQLDDQALFYLRTRGLPRAEARALLTLAFCGEVIDTLPNDELREYLGALLLARLPQTVEAPAA
ncbi:MAG: Fe-S cluster assembly protein SufD [Dokdonella sp.]